MKLHNTYLGFTDDKKPMQAAKIEKSLDMYWRMKNGVFSRKQIVYDWLQNGYLPTIKENYTYYSARIDDYTKPKTLYKLEDMETGVYLEINKTLYDFANYILDNDFLDKEKVSNFIKFENEQEELESIKRLQEEKERQEKLEEKRREEEKARKKRQEEYNRKYLKLGKEFIARLNYNPIKELLDKYVPMYVKLDEQENDRTVPENEVKTFYNNWYEKLVIMIGNYGYCNHTMKSYAEDYRNNEFRKWEFENINLFLEQQTILTVYSNIELTDHANTINTKMKRLYNSGCNVAS